MEPVIACLNQHSSHLIPNKALESSAQLESCPELGSAQPQLVLFKVHLNFLLSDPLPCGENSPIFYQFFLGRQPLSDRSDLYSEVPLVALAENPIHWVLTVFNFPFITHTMTNRLVLPNVYPHHTLPVGGQPSLFNHSIKKCLSQQACHHHYLS